MNIYLKMSLNIVNGMRPGWILGIKPSLMNCVSKFLTVGFLYFLIIYQSKENIYLLYI